MTISFIGMCFIVVNEKHIVYDYIIRQKRHGPMVSDAKWQDRARRLLKAEIARKGVTHKELVEMLVKIGVNEKPQNFANKLSRGGFSAAFLLQCLDVLGCKDLRINWDE
jgi:Domain of unknown function (DUF6471)